ncbi:N-ethylmaleimide reductase [Candidatus Pantoea varia]|uniref:N-ethylmaleimide reductase n=1 Tax=Candidatus Pantoea varia TaxID=1881036 RepID=A0A1I5EPN8_9GAMM|nr:alkene reductase [Pantoea varia]SFO13494.1 N-ethylmaleimide reductase [Pantoea varia]
MCNPVLKHLIPAVKLGDLELKNRIIMAPLTRSRAGEGDVPTPLVAEYYWQRAGAGLIITEASQISPQAKGYPRTPGIFSQQQINGWRTVTDAVHSRDGKIFLQLWHVGRLSHPDVQPGGVLPVAPSALAAEGEIFTSAGLKPLVTPQALTEEGIRDIIRDFRKAAENAREAGFDGVEIHAANGYLIDQFLRDGSNKRTDKWGGSAENRVRFLKEIVASVVPVFGAGRTGVRLSPVFDGFSMSDSNPAATFGVAAEMLSRFSLAYLHVMQLGSEAESFDFTALKTQFGGAYIANGGYSADSAAQAIAEGHADAVSFGTLFLANPDLVSRFASSAPLNEADKTTFYQGEDKGYTDYPVLSGVPQGGEGQWHWMGLTDSQNATGKSNKGEK